MQHHGAPVLEPPLPPPSFSSLDPASSHSLRKSTWDMFFEILLLWVFDFVLLFEWWLSWVQVVKVKVLVAKSRLTLCNPRTGSPPGSSVHEILRARILEWAAIPFSRGSSQHKNQTRVSCIAGRVFTAWATREAPWVQFTMLLLIFHQNFEGIAPWSSSFLRNLKSFCCLTSLHSLWKLLVLSSLVFWNFTVMCFKADVFHPLC